MKDKEQISSKEKSLIHFKGQLKKRQDKYRALFSKEDVYLGKLNRREYEIAEQARLTGMIEMWEVMISVLKKNSDG